MQVGVRFGFRARVKFGLRVRSEAGVTVNAQPHGLSVLCTQHTCA
jgi:hypothetical protein